MYRILIISEREVNPIIGGIERVSYTLTEQWKQLGCSVSWLSRSSSHWFDVNESLFSIQYFLPNSVDALSEENFRYVESIIREKNVNILINQAANVQDLVMLCEGIKQSFPNLKLISSIHFAPHINSLVAKANLFLHRGSWNIKAVLKIIRGVLYYYLVQSDSLNKNEKSALERIVTTSDSVVVLSEQYLPIFSKIVSSNKYVAIYNPLDPIEISSNQKKKQILYVGRIEYGVKRFDRMLSIWNHLSKKYLDWELLVLGDGDYLSYFKEKTLRERIDRIKFLGFDNPIPYYETASILCLTSTCEGFGMVLLEAMQYGCIPVAYNSYAALSDIITDGVNGYTVTAFNQNEYVKKLSQLMQDNDLRRKMSKEGLLVPPRFDSRTIARQWVKLFDSLA